TFVRAGLEPYRPPADLEDRIVSGLRAEGLKLKKKRKLPRIRVPWWARVAAVMLLCIGVGLAASGNLLSIETMDIPIRPDTYDRAMGFPSDSDPPSYDEMLARYPELGDLSEADYEVMAREMDKVGLRDRAFLAFR
ncbi:MAG: hypothetical protein ACYTAF_14445, partial [Planctomycetota bacterium]